ncbi:MAG TPA: tetraacyldisaccharide 4'-kinase [Steroidobacteraceae bacterium]|nr:tetraacyldisaccharide 4'-kinase [Steroidobacteraceae bacterium]
MSLDTTLQSLWYGKSRVAWLLLPLSWLYAVVISIRKTLYRVGILRSVKVSRPVIVVGNISVGGTGKTPLVIWLAKKLEEKGYKVAVIARGYRGKATVWPQLVTSESDPHLVGDEPVLIAQQANCIVIAGPDRVASAKLAIESGADIVISDDGLQHYRLRRDCEIAVVDGSRQLGNGHLLPAGPLREAGSRLKEVDIVIVNQRDANISDSQSSVRADITFRIALRNLRSIKTRDVRPLESLRDQQVHVVTGIGNPESFVNALSAQGLKVSARILRDHAHIQQHDLQFGDQLPVLMTAKDAVKCRKLYLDDRYWAVDADAMLNDIAADKLINCIEAPIKNFRSES